MTISENELDLLEVLLRIAEAVESIAENQVSKNYQKNQEQKKPENPLIREKQRCSLRKMQNCVENKNGRW